MKARQKLFTGHMEINLMQEIERLKKALRVRYKSITENVIGPETSGSRATKLGCGSS